VQKKQMVCCNDGAEMQILHFFFYLLQYLDLPAKKTCQKLMAQKNGWYAVMMLMGVLN